MEHVEVLDLDDSPDLVVIQVYITSARRAYEIADLYRRRGAYVALGGLHVTALPDEAAAHADSIFLGPGEDIWPVFLDDLRRGHPQPRYESRVRTLVGAPPVRRDLIKRSLYLVPNSIVVSRGCPHTCDFCYKEAFYQGGKSFYTQEVDDALAEIARLPGRHLYFLDDHLFGHPRFAASLFEGMRGMGRLWQAAGTVNSVLKPGLLEKAAESGLRSLFVGFETLSQTNLRESHKFQNLNRDYTQAIRRLQECGVIVNGSFVFGMDDDDAGVFDRTVDWAVAQGIETATFHILTPYPGDGACTSGSPPRGASTRRTGIFMTPGMRSSSRRRCRARRLKPATGVPTATSTGGGRSSGGRRPTTRRRAACATSPIRQAGKSSSRCGTRSFRAKRASARCCPAWRRSCTGLACGCRAQP